VTRYTKCTEKVEALKRDYDDSTVRNCKLKAMHTWELCRPLAGC